MSFYLLWGFTALVPLAVILVVRATTDATWPIWLAVLITLVLLSLVLLVGWFRRYFTQYTVTTKRLTIREGILSKREYAAHVDRIQNITIRRARSTGSSRSAWWRSTRPARRTAQLRSGASTTLGLACDRLPRQRARSGNRPRGGSLAELAFGATPTAPRPGWRGQASGKSFAPSPS